jgi:hypothetical protein
LVAAGQPRLAALAEDASGRLWLFFAVPDPSKRRPDRLSSRSGVSALIADVRGYEDTIVEVIDPSTGRLLASRRFTDPLISIGGTFVHTVRESPSGHVFMDVWELQLAGGGPRAPGA